MFGLKKKPIFCINSYGNLFEPIQEQNGIDGKIQENEHGENGFSFDSIMTPTVFFIRYHDTGASIYCILPKPYFNSKSILEVQKTEDIHLSPFT